MVRNNYVHDAQLGIGVSSYGPEEGYSKAVNNLVEYNTVEDSIYGISVQEASVGTTVRYNVIKNNEIGVEELAGFGNVPSETAINYNNIESNENFGVMFFVAREQSEEWGYEPVDVSGHVLDATNNWWGDRSGPSGEGPGNGDAVSESVDYDPWLKHPVNRGRGKVR